jgi:hypothetical protein
MDKPAANAALVVGACLVYLLLSMMSGRTAINGGLGSEGAVYAAMAVDHNLQAAPAVKKLAPAFPLATALIYTMTGDVVSSFFVVNVIAFAVLVFAACWILDLHTAPTAVKMSVVATLSLLGLPSLTSAFDSGQPYLLGVAVSSLAVAASEWSSGILTGILHVGATLASPVGVIAPLYGLWRHLRDRRPPAMAAVYLPALLVWIAVQYWARGGAAGLLDLIRVSRVRADAAFWTESSFILYGLYFLITVLGGLTLLLFANPREIRDAVSTRPELLALVLPVVPFIVTAGLDVPRVLPFLLPFWVVLVAMWGRDRAARLTVPLVLAFLLTLLTQHPWTRISDTNYFVDWFPYTVSAGRVNVSDPRFDTIWRVRMLIGAGGLAAFVALRRTFGR